jgi:hypothetical protein
MIAERRSIQKIASRMLMRCGVAFIWDIQTAAAAAYGLGNRQLAEDLIEIAEAAEQHCLEDVSYEHHLGFRRAPDGQ